MITPAIRASVAEIAIVTTIEILFQILLYPWGENNHTTTIKFN